MLACEWWQDLLTRPTGGMKWREMAKGTFDTHIIFIIIGRRKIC